MKKFVPVKRVVSAGGVIYDKSDGEIRLALISHSGGKVWALPKGIVEKEEDIEKTALREVEEETGLKGEVVKKISVINYWFYLKEEGVKVHKFVHFYLMRCLGGSINQHDWEVERVEWFTLDDAIEKLSYQSEKDVVKKAKELLLSA